MPVMRLHALLMSITAFAAIGCDQQDPGLPSGASGSLAGSTGAAGLATGAAGSGAGRPAIGAAGAAALGGRGGTPSVGTAGAGGSAAVGEQPGAAGAAAGASAGAAGAAPAPSGEGSLFPIKTGNSWSFRTTKGSEIGNKTQTVGALEMVGGTGPKSATMAFKMVTTKDDAMDKTESWQMELEGKIVRYRELAYAPSGGAVELEEHWDPYKLRIDGTQLTVGSAYTETYRETKIMGGAAPVTANSMDTWKVVSVNESVTVPAGTFSAVVIEKVGGTSTKRYWFVRGIGKVKEQSGNQIEELTSYMVKP